MTLQRQHAFRPATGKVYLWPVESSQWLWAPATERLREQADSYPWPSHASRHLHRLGSGALHLEELRHGLASE